MNSFTVFLFSIVFSVSLATPVFFNMNEKEELFLNFVEEYNRTYDSVQEVMQRFNYFKNNLMEINKLNKAHGESVFGITNFADVSPDEINRIRIKPSQHQKQSPQCPVGQIPENVTPPISLDYRNLLSPAKMQGDCGSCWAFSTIGVVEAKYAMKHSKIIDLSEQQLLDCDKDDTACSGGEEPVAMQYIVNNGVMLDKDYPYVAHRQRCQFNPNGELVKLKKCEQFNMENNEEAVTKLLVEKGPLAFAIYSRTLTHFKSKKIYKNCPQDTPDHAVVLVGYGTEDGIPYWIVRNSFGTTWGDNGYLRLRKGANECNMLKYPFTSADIA